MFDFMTCILVRCFRVTRRKSQQPLEEENQSYYDTETDQAGKYQFDSFRHATPPAPDL
jgi:hypothetical protein